MSNHYAKAFGNAMYIKAQEKPWNKQLEKLLQVFE